MLGLVCLSTIKPTGLKIISEQMPQRFSLQATSLSLSEENRDRKVKKLKPPDPLSLESSLKKTLFSPMMMKAWSFHP